MKGRILLVDGHSMVFQWPGLAALHARNTAAARGELVRMLTGLQDFSDWTVAVVFDGRGPKATSDGEKGGVAVFYSKSGQSADSVIERLAAKYSRTHDVTVATEDHAERTTVEAFGCIAIGADRLREEIERAGSDLRERFSRKGR
jgi:predicted RNA-binding protein with PIN domain